ncbi:CBS domain-containing protein [Candidatus Uabimicrobium sp. HlEnr_7]|uniref:CBS domain-containing protein n=1 Tax=Candidatus Uabimicrobium helgolandensis TaxID=3095367 RepID=UPI003558266B
MGEQNVRNENDPKQLRHFMKHVLEDLRALEEMLSTPDFFETNIRRIGAEQELFLVDNAWRPAPVAEKILQAVEDEHFTTELAKFNIEANLDPVVFGGDCLRKMEQQLNGLLDHLRGVTSAIDTEFIMTGILPTLRKSDLGLENMTQNPRYFALNDAMNRLRKSEYQFQMRGKDELIVRHDSIMLEACNTSFQVHFQVSPNEFAKLYNFAQTITAPVLAAATNSPMLFGRRLWKETRIAVFQQAVDTRNPGLELNNRTSRVSFGDNWLQSSILEIFKDNIARFRVLLGAEDIGKEKPFEKLAQGIPPRLKALMLHNGTIYRWNRPCYGISDSGKPHLRIENRVIPSGPTVLDEMANSALFFGLMSGLSDIYDDITEVMDFDDAKANFLAASRLGLDAQFTWIEGKVIPAQKLICDQLIPLAKRGLEKYGIDASDIDRYLGVIEKRVTKGTNGAEWLLASRNKLQSQGTPDQVLAAVTSATVKNQKTGQPVHEWPLASIEDAGKWKNNYMTVGQFMTTNIFTVHEDELIELVANLMDWNHIRHVIVENDEGNVVGIVSYRRILRLFGRHESKIDIYSSAVSSIMQKSLITVSPETSTLKAIELLRKNRISFLPVVKGKQPLGVVTERDFVNVAGQLLEQILRD